MVNRARGMSKLWPMGAERSKGSKGVMSYYLGNHDARC
jgi:hypothetical protein